MTLSTVQPGMRAALASPFTPIAVINGTPIYPMQGGRSGGGIQIVTGDDDGTPDDDLLDGDDEDDDGEDDDEADEPDEDEKPARRGRKADDGDGDGALARMEAALKKANSTAAKYRRAGRALERLGIDDLPTYLTERGIDPESGRPYGEDVVDPDDTGDTGDGDLFDERPTERRDTRKSDRDTVRAVRAAKTAAEARARETYVPILAQQAATLALREAGFKGNRAKMDKVLRLIDPNDLDIVLDGDEFEIEGLDDAISAIQDDFPELFKAVDEDDDDRPARRTAAKTTGTGRPRTPARRASGARDVDGGERGRPAKKQGGWVEQIVAQMDKRGR
jgi:hypothetical protein